MSDTALSNAAFSAQRHRAQRHRSRHLRIRHAPPHGRHPVAGRRTAGRDAVSEPSDHVLAVAGQRLLEVSAEQDGRDDDPVCTGLLQRPHLGRGPARRRWRCTGRSPRSRVGSLPASSALARTMSMSAGSSSLPTPNGKNPSPIRPARRAAAGLLPPTCTGMRPAGRLRPQEAVGEAGRIAAKLARSSDHRARMAAIDSSVRCPATGEGDARAPGTPPPASRCRRRGSPDHPRGGRGGQLLGQHQGIALGHDEDPGPQPHRRGHRGHVRQPDQRIGEDRSPPRTEAGPRGRRDTSTGIRREPPRGRRSRSTRSRRVSAARARRMASTGSTNGPMLAKATPNFTAPYPGLLPVPTDLRAGSA